MSNRIKGKKTREFNQLVYGIVLLGGLAEWTGEARGRFHILLCALRPSFAPVKSFSKVGAQGTKVGRRGQNRL